MTRSSIAALGLIVLATVSSSAQSLCVTSGSVAAAASGWRRIEDPSVRAVVEGSDGSSAQLRFRYLGPSAQSHALASGEMRRQIGLKLRARDGCNLIYVMWRIEPEAGIVVSLKLNPSRARSAQCHAEGYTNLSASAGVDPPPLKHGVSHELRARIEAAELFVEVEGREVWRGALPAAARGLKGPAGLRSDNGRFDFQIDAAPGTQISDAPCAQGEAD